jgi:enoyl-CoA hydratase
MGGNAMNNAEHPSVRVTDADQVRTITIDRAEKSNLLTLEMIAVLARAFAGTPETAKAIHFTGTGADFCRGRDPQGNPVTTNALELRAALVEPILTLYDAMAACPVPIVCSARGLSNGLGAALATASDITIASTNARFRLSEMEKNLPPTLAMSAMMRRVPQKALTFLVLGMDEIDAPMALSMGLVSSVVEDERLDAEVSRYLATLVARSRPALVAVKDYLRVAPELGPRSARDLAANLLAAVLTSQ